MWDKEFEEPSNYWKSVFATREGVLIFVKTSLQNDLERICNFFNVFKHLGINLDKTINIFMYYSPRDITATLMTREKFKELVISEEISKKRNINGKYKSEEYGVTLKFIDLIGAFNSSLDGAFDLVGLENKTKDLIPKEMKSKMNKVIKEDPDRFATYAMGDTKDLFKLWQLRVEQINKIVENSLGFNPGYTVDNCARTSGKLVSETFLQWLDRKYPALMIAIEFLSHVPTNISFKRNIFASQLTKQAENILENGLIKLLKNKKDFDYFTASDLRNKYLKSNSKKHGQSISGLARGSLPALGMLSNNSQSLNAIVNGGRCNNEHPREFQIEDVLDIDMSSCYGTTLRDLDFPIGRPKNVECTKKYKGKSKPMTLGDVLKKYEDKFVDGLWQLVLESPKDENGKPILLTFEQDLLYSKLGVTPESVRSDLRKDVGDEICDDTTELSDLIDFKHVDGDFKLLRSEFKNVILTSHSLDIIKKVSKKKELTQILNMNVVAGVYYDKGDKVEPEKLFDILVDPSKRGDYHISKEDSNYTLDNRTTKWTQVPLEEFIGKFIDYRGVVKKKKECQGDKYDVEQTAVKLFINTLYGCLASPYFPIGNAILANNITDKARCGVWMISKALGTVQSITDGGAYSNNNVRFFKTGVSRFDNYKPGLHDLSDYERLNNNRTIKTGKLIDDFPNLYSCLNDKKTREKLDEYALKHINKFWSVYNKTPNNKLELPFSVEHKYENTCERMIYGNSSDYLMLNPVKATKVAEINNLEIKNIVSENEIDKLNKENVITPYTIKVRSAKQDDHVNKKWLFYLAGLIKKPDPSYEYTQIIGIGQLKEALKSANTPTWANYLVPGETLSRTTTHKPNTSKIQPVSNEEEYKSRKKRKNNRDRRYKKEWAEDNTVVYGLMNKMSVLFDEDSKEKYYTYLREGDDTVFAERSSGKGVNRKGRGDYKRSR